MNNYYISLLAAQTLSDLRKNTTKCKKVLQDKKAKIKIWRKQGR